MRTRAQKAAAFRALHERPGAFIIPNPWDAGTAKLLASLGFEALATTSLGLANSLGRADGTGAVVERNILTGLATLQLVNPGEDSPLLSEVPAGERFPVIREGKSNMEHVSQSLDQLVEHGDATMQSLTALLSPDNRAALGDVLRNMRRVTEHADATLAKADAALVWPFDGKDGPLGRAQREAGVRQARVTREREMLAEARAELDAGLGISGPALEEWLTAFANGEERPIPAPPSPKPR